MKQSYKPKAIAGQRYNQYIKVSSSQVKRWITDGNTFNGFIVGNKVSSFHFFRGCNLACMLNVSTVEEFTNHINSFMFYLDSELGNRAAIYLKA